MAKPLRPKRGTTAKNDAFVGLASEITIDTTKHSIRVHDGVTAGGHEILPKSENDKVYQPKGNYLTSAPVTSVNGQTGAVSVDVGVTSFNGSKGAVTYSAPVSSVNGKTGAVTGLVTSVNGSTADASGNVSISLPATPKAYVTATWKSGSNWYRKWSDGFIEQGGVITTSNTSYATGTVTLNTAMTTNTYALLMQSYRNPAIDIFAPCISSKDTTSFGYKNVIGNGSGGASWYVCGY